MLLSFLPTAAAILVISFIVDIQQHTMKMHTDWHVIFQTNRISREKLCRGDLRTMAAVYFLAIHFLVLYAFVTR